MTREEYLAKSHWWNDKKRTTFLQEYGVWEIIQEDDGFNGFNGSDTSLGLYQGRLTDVLDKAISFGDSFWGWGHQGRIEKKHVEIV